MPSLNPPSLATPLPMTPGNSAKLLVGDNATYNEALRLIASAKTSIQFETFTFNGEQGQGITDALICAAARGVKVQVVLDTKAMFIGGQKKLAQQLAAGGVDVRQYRERNLNGSLWAIDHAKILTVDDQTAIVGGTNFDRRVNYDLNFEVQGPAVPQIQDKFVQSWGNSHPDGDLYARGTQAAPSAATVSRGLGQPRGDTSIAITETAARTNAQDGPQTAQDAVSAIRNATTSIDLLMFNLDDPREIQALVEARQRGVKVRVVLNHESSRSLLGKLKSQALNLNMQAVETLRAAGADVRWFKLPPGTDEMHAKVALFDGQTVLGGSTNWVHSSNYNNHELGVWLQGGIASQVQGVYDDVWTHQTAPIAPLSRGDRARADVAGFLSRFL